MNNEAKKILVCMSGGVDSSVAATLLVKAGYDVTGAFMINYDEKNELQKSCWVNDYQDALRVAAKLGIKLLRLNFTKEYKNMVLDYMYREYGAGRTPNPDVLCNKFIKFGVWLEKAKELGFDYMATGHYARLRYATPGQANLIISKDENKDQTYFLHQLTQNQLKSALFPVGDYTKKEVRELAREFNLPTAEKEESMGICFIGEVPMKDFLLKKIKPSKGDVVDPKGNVLGQHQGLPFYTIGERGLAINGDEGRSFYVLAKIESENKIIAGHEDDPLLYKTEITIGEVNWISGSKPELPLNCEVRLRHRQPFQKAIVCFGHDELAVKFETPQRAVTPGQFAVFYKDSECLGGGVIE